MNVKVHMQNSAVTQNLVPGCCDNKDPRFKESSSTFGLHVTSSWVSLIMLWGQSEVSCLKSRSYLFWCIFNFFYFLAFPPLTQMKCGSTFLRQCKYSRVKGTLGVLPCYSFHIRLFQVGVPWQCLSIISAFCFNVPESCNYDLSAVI